MHLEVVVVLHLNILQIKDSFHILLSLWFIQKSFIVWLGNDFTPNRAQALHEPIMTEFSGREMCPTYGR